MKRPERLAPELRFPEFEGDWSEGKLNDLVSSLDAGVSVNSDNRPAKGNEKGILKTSCVTSGRFDFKENKVVQELNEVSRLKESVARESIIISRMNTPALVGANSYIDKDYPHLFLPDRLWAAKTKVNHVAKWVGILTSTIKVRSTFSSRATGTSGTMKNITKDDVLTVNVCFPRKLEQQKIADFLTTVDDKLTTLRRKRELIDTYKRGLMQQIFSQQIRFKQDDGREFGAWEERLFTSVYSWVKTNSLSRDELTIDMSSVQNIHYGDIHKRFSSLFKQSGEGVPYIKNEQFIDKLSDEEFCQNGDVVIADASEDYADIGKALEIIEVKDKTLVAGLHTYVARPKIKLASGFSCYLFQSACVRKSIQKIAQGVSVLGISKTNLGKIEIEFPKFEEQQKIADCLSSFDQKLDALDQQINQLDVFKKGLLQKMFV